MSPRFPIGFSDFKEIRTGGFYYVDKTRLVADVLRAGKVVLLPRPRRFGKTLNLSMLRYFFGHSGEEGPLLFEGLAVAEDPDTMAHQGGYPTVFLTFKDIKYDNFDDCLYSLGALLSGLFVQFAPHFTTLELAEIERRRLEVMLAGGAGSVDYQESLALLTELLFRSTGKQCVVLVDEYDTPIHAGFSHGYYPKIVSFMRNLFSGAFKDNNRLMKGVISGTLRVAKESIFSGLNNLDVHTLVEKPFSPYFGFTEEEVRVLLAASGQTQRESEAQTWYNGYRFGDHVMFNPWSVMKMVAYPDNPLQPWWINTSDNEVIRRLVIDDCAVTPEERRVLLDGGFLPRSVETDIALGRETPESVWSLLLMSGYLKAERVEYREGGFFCRLSIPNLEVRTFWEKTIRGWVRERVGVGGLKPLLSSLLSEDIAVLEKQLTELVRRVLSFHDTAGTEPERVYHAFILGMLVDLRGSYQVLSNKESGLGRYDICLLPRDPKKTAFVFELKRTDGSVDEAANAALAQVERRDYAASIFDRGVGRICALGVGLKGKEVVLKSNLLTA